MTTATPTSPQIATEIATGASDFPPDQHTLGRSILLHLLPGALILAAYLAFYPLTATLGLPALLALLLATLLAVVVAAIPSQLGHLLYQGYRSNRRLSLEGVVVFRRRAPLWQYLLFVPLGVIWRFGWYGVLAPLRRLPHKERFRLGARLVPAH